MCESIQLKPLQLMIMRYCFVPPCFHFNCALNASLLIDSETWKNIESSNHPLQIGGDLMSERNECISMDKIKMHGFKDQC